jgi:small-conductance mechanosensitive channel
MLQQFEQLLAELLATDVQTVGRWLTALVIVAAVLALRMALNRLIEQRVEDVQVRHRWRRTVSYVTLFVAFVAGVSIVVREIQPLLTAIGLIGAGLAIVFRDPIVNFIGWMFIVSARPFEVGNRIELGESRGDVIDVQLFQTVLLEIGEWVEADQSTGRLLHVPNQKVFTEALANYHKGMGYIWHELSMTLTFESDITHAEHIIHEIADAYQTPVIEAVQKGIKGAQHRYPIMYDHLEPGVFIRVVENGVDVTLRYLTDPRRRRTSEHELWTKILHAFAREEEIAFAYPTTRFYGESKTSHP